MTKQEAISKTEYTESELIDLAITMAVQRCKEWRTASEDIEGWDHYEDLKNAFEAILEERKAKA